MPHIVVCYDVVCDRRRNRIMNTLRQLLPHVQKSVFEGTIETPDLVQLRQRLQELIEPTEDTVRIYTLCPRCIPATEVLGLGHYVPDKDADQVI